MRSDPTKVHPEESGTRSLAERRRRALKSRKEKVRRLSLESLEVRELLAVLPAAQVSSPVQVSVSGGNYSMPSIAVDPTNPNNLVMVWTRNDPVNISATNQPARVEGAVSTNGGLSWNTFTPYTSKIDPSTASGTPASYAQVTDAAVDFDRNGNFHVVVAQHSADNNNGEIQYNKFNFNNGVPTGVVGSTNIVLTSWLSSVTPVNRALKPTIAVDKGVTSFSDVNSVGQTVTQGTNGSGNVYIAWATNDDNPGSVANWNPNVIRMRASLDNGATFLPATAVSAGGNFGSERNTAPRIAVSQGTASAGAPTVVGGTVTVVWDDFGSGATANPPVDLIKVQRYRPGVGVLNAVGGNITAAQSLVRGQQGYGGLTGSAAQPLGIGPAPTIASDNTLGAYSEFQGRLYITYVGRFDDTNNPATNSDIYLITSTNGGATWSNPRRVNDDVGAADGYSGADVPSYLQNGSKTSVATQGGRAQMMPQVAVDQLNGTVVVSYTDTRFDAAQARVATMIATSIDGGVTFGPQTFANASQTATDQATGQTIVLGPVPDNNSSGNNMPNKDGTFGFGDRQGLAVLGGKIYPAWSSNANGGNDGQQLLKIRVGQVTMASGPRIVDGTMGPVSNALATDGGPVANSFTVTFDRRIDPGTFTAADVQIVGRDTSGALLAFQPVVTGVAATNTNSLGATQFQVTFQSQASAGPSVPGTYSYTVGPNINDRIRRADPGGTQISAGNAMDQNSNANGGQANADRFAAPQTVGTAPFTAPYVRDTLPLVVPGPHVVSTSVPGQPATTDNLVLNGTVSSIDVTFDRDMDASSFEADGRDVLRIQGPAGLVSGPFTVAALNSKTFRITFPTQQLSGTYTIVLGPEIRSASGYAIDADLDAGVDALRGVSTLPSVPLTYNSAASRSIPANSTVTSTITLPTVDDFVIQNFTLSLNINFPRDPDLTVELVAPDGTVTQLFSGVGTTGTQANFQNTIFDDAASTSIVNGGPPFFGRFRPQDSQGLNKLNGSSSIGGPQGTGAGVYTLRITNAGTSTGTLTNWSVTLSKPVSGSGLGELVADRTSTSFRIFTMDPTNPLASTTWTSVGPASIQAGQTSGAGRVGGLAVDPSDPSGNTVFVAGATGGVWKTTNFLTTSPNGPTYIPLTDFGPTLGVNIGGIAVFGRNNDPNQSVVIVSTGDGDGGIPGVGFLRSLDGGATWTLLDSTNNTLPFASRNHSFVGTTSFKVVADPNPSPSGKVILYAALSGNNGGIWRSTDTGDTWTLLRAGQATDVLLDPASGPVDAVANPTGNLQVVYGAFRGQGVFISPNQGQVWSQMLGGVGSPFIQDPDRNNAPIQIQNQGATPNGAKGRIVLAKPALVASSEPNATLKNLLYQGWLFAYVATPNDFQDGLYVTKDQGQNWTRIHIPGLANIGTAKRAVPSNDTGLADYDVLGDPAFQGQGNYDIAITIDPNNPNVVYLGGFGSQPSGLVRVDLSALSDSHAFYLATDRPDGGTLSVNATDTAALKTPIPGVQSSIPFLNLYGDPRATPTVNLIRNPFNPLGASNTFYVLNVNTMNNTGAGAKWIPIDGLMDGVDVHRMMAIRDPLTGKSRLIIGNDHGVWSSVDNGDGTIDAGIGNAVAPSLSRNGNLQITQFYYGAAQPSNLAAQIAGALFYGQAQDDGFPASDPNLLTNGNITWGVSARGDGTGVATDQTGSGTLYQYNWPCCGGNKTDFFLVNGVGRTFGLIQASGTGQVPDPQWPNTGGFNFAVNPVNGNQIVISSGAGRVFRTQDQGQFWLVIGDPAALDGTNAQALAYGAPLPSDPTGALDNFIYAGTVGGRIFVTFTGGGANGNAWTNLSAGLDGSSVQAIVTNPTRGSREAFAVTSNGVYYMANSAAPGATWQNITGNVFQITHNAFGLTGFTSQKLLALKSIVADWRYVIPDNPANPTGPTHPMLYVAGNGGVYRSSDKGATWTLFPTAEAGSYYASPNPAGVTGGLPNADVRDLDLSLGNIDPTTGRPVAQPGDPNILLATTYGRGSFAIRLAPVVFANLVSLSDSLPAPGGSTNGGTDPSGNPIVKIAQPYFEGNSQQTAFGHIVRITLLDLTDPNNIKIIGGYDPSDGSTDVTANRTDSFGNFSVQVKAGAFGNPENKTVRTIGIQATDASGTQGNIATYRIYLDVSSIGNVNQPPVAPTLGLLPIDDTSGGLNITKLPTPRLTGTTDPSVTVDLYLADANGNPTGAVLATTTSSPLGVYTLTFPNLGDGSYKVVAVATNAFGSTPGTPFTFQIKTSAPTTKPSFGLLPADDTGLPLDNVTSNHRPRFVGVTDPGAKVQLYKVVNGARVGGPLATTTADPSGNFSIQLPNALNNGTITLQVGFTDIAGNQGPYSDFTSVSVVTVAADYTGVGKTTPSLFRRDPLAGGLWFAQGVTPANGVAYGSSSLDIPFTGDFDGDGISDRAVYRPSSQTWYLGRSSAGEISFALGSAGNIPVTADADGDGVTDAGVYNPTTGGWIFAGSTSGTINVSTPVTTPAAGDIPVTGNFNGSGPDELGIYRPSTKQFFIQGSGGPVLVTTGSPGIEDPVPGNYDDSYDVNTQVAYRKTEPAVFNRSTGQWAILRPNGNVEVVNASSYVAGDIPAPGDYDGTGRTQIAVYRPGVGTFVAGGTTGNVAYGQYGDIPLTSPLVYRNLVNITTTLGLASASDSGFKGDLVTSIRRPVFSGKTDPNTVVDLIRVDPSNAANNVVVGSTTSNASGDFSIPLSPNADLLNGVYTVQAVSRNLAGAIGQATSPLAVRLVTTEGDYTGDGVTDQAVFRRTNFSLIDWYVREGAATPFGAGGLDIPVAGDFNGDGKLEPAVYRPATSQWFSRRPNAAGDLLTPNGFGWPGVDIPVPADYDGDGTTDIAVYRPVTTQTIGNGAGNWYIQLANGGTRVITPPSLALAGDIAAPADYNGDGLDDPAIYRPASSQWIIITPSGVQTVLFGGPNDQPVPGVYDLPTAGRKAEPAVYRPSTGQFFVLGPNNAGRLQATFGAGAIPAPGDYNGDGLTDATVYRGPQHLWLTSTLTTPAPTAINPLFGGPVDVPPTSPYVYRLPAGTSSSTGGIGAASTATDFGSTARTFGTGGSTTDATTTAANGKATPRSIFQNRAAARLARRGQVNSATPHRRPGSLF